MILKLKHDLVGYKRVVAGDHRYRIVTLIIPAGSIIRQPPEDVRPGPKMRRRHLPTKYRASQAYVAKGSGYSRYDRNFKYTKGEMVRPTTPFNYSNAACASGIHFFLSRREAERYLV